MSARIPVLDHGYVELIGSMGGDLDIVNGARQSFDQASILHYPECINVDGGAYDCTVAKCHVGGGAHLSKKDAGLVNFLMRERHTSPFELVTAKFGVQLPIFVAREWMRHRTQCLSASTKVSFDLPGGVRRGGFQHFELTMGELWDRWQPSEAKARPDRQGNPYFKRDRVKGMMLRCVDEDTGLITHTKIADVIQSGEKVVYDATFSNGKTVRCTLDHRFLTDSGWMTLRDASNAPVMFATNGRWNPEGVVVSNAGYVLLTQHQDHPLACKNGAVLEHRKIAFDAGLDPVCTICDTDLEWGVLDHKTRVTVDHIDRDKTNNHIDNLRVLCGACNTREAVTQDREAGVMSVDWHELLSLECVGVEMTYDLSVEGPWHNFIANGSVVHNSFNETSGRYTVLPELFYVPDRDAVREQKGKPGAYYYERMDDDAAAENTQSVIRGTSEEAFAAYRDMLDNGVAKEIARLVLPVNTYTRFVVSANLLNWMRFLSLRNHEHAQWEIREYALAIEALCAQVAPVAMAKFVEHGRLQ